MQGLWNVEVSCFERDISVQKHLGFLCTDTFVSHLDTSSLTLNSVADPKRSWASWLCGTTGCLRTWQCTKQQVQLAQNVRAAFVARSDTL
jgi:hypothetical protein